MKPHHKEIRITCQHCDRSFIIRRKDKYTLMLHVSKRCKPKSKFKFHPD